MSAYDCGFNWWMQHLADITMAGKRSMYFSARYNERTPQRVATALGEQVHRLITIRGFYTEHAGDRVKQVIMTRLVAGSSSKTINVNVPVVCELGR